MKTKDCINGKIIIRDLTEEEKQERNRSKKENLPTTEERVSALEQAILEMVGVKNG